MAFVDARTAAVDSNDEAQMEAAVVRAREAHRCWNHAAKRI